ncbi:uncharacterized protein LOC110456702 [Mizuhopecten yessoensis]|uniref:DUF4536 domain-containing protein n=1 Tax=Mizuhopecten yessoensis TaxID=6573 RepID=A0A210QAD7_MIZYE|nr:uncharacterized protein LOC110456702 [Mizuhopecten yessoensis]OWF45704.1 hypothetical protein KP79_PYT10313 [Mizuhopecten yessoensis]
MDRIRRMLGTTREDYSQDCQSRIADNTSLNSKAVPDQDCLECKLIGTAVPVGAAGYILYHHRQKIGVYKGYEGMLWNILCLGMSSALILVGGCRFFDCGMFKHLKTNSKTDTSQDDKD